MIVNIKAKDGSGEFRAYFSKASEANKPGVVLMFEGYGLNSMIQKIADSISRLGFNVVCPDLYWRVQEGMQEYEDYDWNYVYDAESVLSENKAIEDLQATGDYLKRYAEGSGEVIGIGFGLGGQLACLMSTYDDLACNIAFYPLGLEKQFEIKDKLKKPLLIHLAGKDEYVDQSIRDATVENFKVSDLVDIEIYKDSQHGFMRGKSSYYDKKAASKAELLSLAFIKKVVTI